MFMKIMATAIRAVNDNHNYLIVDTKKRKIHKIKSKTV